MASRLSRYVFATGYNGGIKRTPICAYSEKQARFFLFDMAKTNNRYLPCSELIEVTGLYPGDVAAVWNVEQKQFVDRTVR